MSKNEIEKSVSRLFWLCWLAYSMSYIGRLNFSACMAAMLADGGLTKAYLGSVGTGFLACYGAGQLVNGILGDKISPKFMVGIGLFGAGFANIWMGLNTIPALMFFIWCANGYFHSMLWSPIVRVLSEWLPKAKQSKAGANISTTIPVGTILSYSLSSILLTFTGWRFVFIVDGILLVAASLVWIFGISTLKEYIATREGIKIQGDAHVADNAPLRPIKARSMPVLIIGTGLIFAVIAILFNGILKDGVTLWVPTYITEFFGVTPQFSAALAIIMPVVSLGGAYTAVWLNKKYYNNELTTAGVLFGVSALAFVCLFLFGRYNIILAVSLIAVSLSGMLGVNSMLLTFIPFHFSKLGKAASITGFLNACSYFASALSSVTIGVIAEKSGWNITILSWLIVAVCGAAVCLAGKSFWARGRSRVASGWGYR
ncbi:MAG: MFS transporter [Clostridiales bacterium]|nr:MFS transporter [Clostridiales bacterium]